MMRKIDLNCDMGESFGPYKMGRDEEIIKCISSANIACGWHAGDAGVMNRSVLLARRYGVGVGAHPGYPDLQGFGRRGLDCTREETRDYVIYQIGALMAFCMAHGVKMRHVKPHGSLYQKAVEDPDTARAVAEAIAGVDPKLLYVALAGPGGALVASTAHEAGLTVVHEAFADRAYTPDGRLLSRKIPGAVISHPNEVADRALRMAKEGKVAAVDGTVIEMKVHTLCVHGDTPNSLELARKVHSALVSEGIAIQPMG